MTFLTQNLSGSMFLWRSSYILTMVASHVLTVRLNKLNKIKEHMIDYYISWYISFIKSFMKKFNSKHKAKLKIESQRYENTKN